MRIGLLVTGDTSVRAAHSLQAHPGVDEVVVIGPAQSKSFEVVSSAAGCDCLVGSGETAPRLAQRHGVPLIWDGPERRPGVAVWGASPEGIALALATREPDPRLVALAQRHGVPLIWDGPERRPGVAVWGASPEGIALALATREPDPRLVALAHPEIAEGPTTRVNRFPDPVGRVGVRDEQVDGRPIAIGRSPNEFAACLVEGATRRVTVVDHGAFLAGVALAAAVSCLDGVERSVWDSALPYLQTVTEMGLVMAESG